MTKEEMADEAPKYFAMDAYCWICEHHWKYHYDKGCYAVINRAEVEIMGKQIKFCACKETTSKSRYNNN